MTPARQSALSTFKRRLKAEHYDGDVLCTYCRQWVRRDATHMVPIGNGRGRVQCRHHPAPETRHH